MTFSPNENYRFVLKRGMSGFDVWAVQIAFNAAGPSVQLTLDGDFGPITEGVAREIQRALNITVDGIVGPQTQSRLCERECTRAGALLVPAGLLKGICFGESGGIIPTTSAPFSDGSRDYGPLQSHLLRPSQQQLIEAFNPKLQATRVGQGLKAAHARFLGAPGAKSEEVAWRLAVLDYNWPAAAQQIAEGHGDTWVYTESGSGAKRHLADAAPWIQALHIPGVETGWEWAAFYVTSKTTYVTSWSVP